MKFRKTTITYCDVNVTLTLVNHKYFYKEHVVCDSYDVNNKDELLTAFRDFLNCNSYERILFELVANNHKEEAKNAMGFFIRYRGHKLQVLSSGVCHEINGKSVGYLGISTNKEWVSNIDDVVFDTEEKRMFLKDHESRKAGYKEIFDNAIRVDLEDRLRHFTNTENTHIKYPKGRKAGIIPSILA